MKLLLWTTGGRGPKRRRRLSHTPKMVMDCIVLLIIGHIATFIAAIVYKIWPQWSLEKSDWFLSPWFKMEMGHEWYLKLTGDYLLNVITYYLLAKIAAKFSESLFLIAVIFFGYHVIDLIMFYWDFNGGFYMYLDLLWTCIILIKYAVLPVSDEKMGRIKSFF